MKKANLGCGLTTPLGWTNIDNSWSVYAGKSKLLRFLFSRFDKGHNERWANNILCHDLRNGLPFKDGEVDVIYASHILEHLYMNQAFNLLKDCRRVLKKERGVCRVVVPDLKGASEKYLRGQMKADEFIGYMNMQSPICLKGGWLKRIYFFCKGYPHFHKWMYDIESLSQLFVEAGFSKIVQKELYDSKIEDIRVVETKELVGFGVGIAIEAYT